MRASRWVVTDCRWEMTASRWAISAFWVGIAASASRSSSFATSSCAFATSASVWAFSNASRLITCRSKTCFIRAASRDAWDLRAAAREVLARAASMPAESCASCAFAPSRSLIAAVTSDRAVTRSARAAATSPAPAVTAEAAPDSRTANGSGSIRRRGSPALTGWLSRTRTSATVPWTRAEIRWILPSI